MELFQRQQLEAALLASFDTDGLRQLTRFVLDMDLDAISTGDNAQRVANLVDYAERHGKLPTLVAGAVRQNPGNEQLQLLITRSLLTTYDVVKKKAVAA